MLFLFLHSTAIRKKLTFFLSKKDTQKGIFRSITADFKGISGTEMIHTHLGQPRIPENVGLWVYLFIFFK